MLSSLKCHSCISSKVSKNFSEMLISWKQFFFQNWGEEKEFSLKIAFSHSTRMTRLRFSGEFPQHSSNNWANFPSKLITKYQTSVTNSFWLILMNSNAKKIEKQKQRRVKVGKLLRFEKKVKSFEIIFLWTFKRLLQACYKSHGTAQWTTTILTVNPIKSRMIWISNETWIPPA